MSRNNSKFDAEIDAGKFFLGIFMFFFVIGLIFLMIWFFKNVYNPEERAYIKGVRYAYSNIQNELIDFYSKNQHIFDAEKKDDDEFCQLLISKYAKNGGGCTSFNPNFPVQNFTFKGKKIAIYGLEKPVFKDNGAYVKDIIVDINGENKGDNQVGSDRAILRIYSSGRMGVFITPVNCSRDDEKEYGMKRSTYCIGGQEINYLAQNKPLGFDIIQIAGDKGKTKVISNNVSFIRADCMAFGGDLLGDDDYCEAKMFYWLKGCYDDYVCNINLTKQ